MINNNENTLSIIRSVATRLIPGCKVMLFGSRARKDNSMDSDYDFLVISKTTIDIQTKRLLKSRMRMELTKFKIPADILIQSEEEINYKKEITGHILKQALREGVIVKDSKSTNNDWWNDLTETQKSGIERGLSDIKEGRTRSHEDVKNKYGL